LAAERPQKVISKEKAIIVPTIDTDEPRPDNSVQQQEAAGFEAPVSEETPPTKIAQAAIPQPPQSIEQIRQHWGEFVNACRGMGSSGNLDALLRSACEAVALEGDTLVLTACAVYSLLKTRRPRHNSKHAILW
jgi:hypothetical protein